MPKTKRRRVIVDDSALAAEFGRRLRESRRRAGLTQQRLAEGRYTKAYVSALENGLVKPSMSALTFFAERLGIPPSQFLADAAPALARLEADLLAASGEWRDAVDAYEALLERPADRAARAEVLRGLAEALYRLDRPAEAIRAATEASDLFAGSGRAADAALARYWLAAALFALENPAEARAILQEILAQLRGGLAVLADFTVRVLVALSEVESHDGAHRAALAYLEEARGLAGDLDDRRRATLLYSLATTYRDAGDLEAAIRAGTQALVLFRAAEAERETASLENEMALAYLAVGDTRRAAEMVAEARARFSELGDTRWLAYVADTEARVKLARGDLEGGLRLADEAIGLAEANDNPKALLDALVTRARALIAADRLGDAEATYQRAAALAREGPSAARRREVLGAWADALARLGRHEEAYALAREALTAD